MLRSQNPHRPPLKYLIFVFFIIFVKHLKDFWLPEIAPLIENHITSQSHKSLVKEQELEISLKYEAFLVIVYNIFLLHHIANKILINFHIKTFSSFYGLWMLAKIIFSAHLLLKENFRQYQYYKLDELDRYETLFYLHRPTGKVNFKGFSWNEIMNPTKIIDYAKKKLPILGHK